MSDKSLGLETLMDLYAGEPGKTARLVPSLANEEDMLLRVRKGVGAMHLIPGSEADQYIICDAYGNPVAAAPSLVNNAHRTFGITPQESNGSLILSMS